MPAFVFLSLGFIAWGVCFSFINVGYFHLDLEQYAAAAVLSIMYTLVAVGTALLVAVIAAGATKEVKFSIAPRTAQIVSVAYWVLAGATLLALAVQSASLFASHVPDWLPATAIFTGVLTLVLQALIADAKSNRPALFAWRIFYAVIVLLATPLSFIALAKMQHLPLSRPDYTFGSAFYVPLGAFLAFMPPLAPTRRPPTEWKSPHRRTWSWVRQSLVKWQPEAWAPVGFTALMAAVVVGSVILPKFPQELGGAAPREAVLVMQPGAFDNETRSKLFASDKWMSSGFERTLNMTVLFQTTDWLFVQPDAPSSAKYQIPRREVQTLQWL